MDENKNLITINNLKEGKHYEVLYRNWTSNNWDNPHTIINLGKFIKKTNNCANIFNNSLEFYNNNKTNIFHHRAIHIYREVSIIDRIIRIII